MSRTSHTSGTETMYLCEKVSDGTYETSEEEMRQICEELMVPNWEVCGPNISVDVTMKRSFTPGRMYRVNGDPGYPDEEDSEWEVDKILFSYPSISENKPCRLSVKEFEEMFPILSSVFYREADDFADEIDCEPVGRDY